MRILLTGAAGRLGSVVCRQLVEQGEEVVAVDALYRADLPVKQQVVNLLDRTAIYPLVEECQAVVHLANHPNLIRGLMPQTVYAENVTADANVLQAAMDVGVRQIIFSSSIQVICGTRGGVEDLAKPSCLAYFPVDGALPPTCGNLYALGKQTTENLLKFYAAHDPARSYTAIRFPGLINRVEQLQWPGQTKAHLDGLDEMFAYLTHADAAAFIRAVLAANRPGYACCLPASPKNRIGWSVPEMVRTFYPQVPLRRPLGEIQTLIDVDVLRADYGWEAQDVYALPRLQVEGVPENACGH
jgi:nucleoside-diphosphate-sugar epimerase